VKSIDKQIFDKIKYSKMGTIYFPEDFSQFGSPGAIRLTLHRLADKGEIERVAQGIYTRPKQSKNLGKLIPTAEEIAKAIARRDRARIIPTGSYALNVLGLSTQVPLKIVYLTDGAPRIIRVGKRTIAFKKTTPKNLAAKGELSSMVIQALRAIGKGRITEDEERKIINILKEEDKNHLKHDIKLAPAWIAQIMNKAIINHG
jgi:hypothetical protein